MVYKISATPMVENGSLVADEAGLEIIFHCFLAARDFVGARRFRPL
jgi:hypothetical protein